MKENQKTDYQLRIEDLYTVSLDIFGAADTGSRITQYFHDISSRLLNFSSASCLHITVSDIKNDYRFTFPKNQDWTLSPSVKLGNLEELYTPEKDAYVFSLAQIEELLFHKILGNEQKSAALPALVFKNTEQPQRCVLHRLQGSQGVRIFLDSDSESTLVLPIRCGQEYLGSMSFEWPSPHDAEQELEMYQHLCDLIGFARSHRQTKFLLGERLKELTTIYQITRLGAELGKSLDDVMNGVVDIIPPGFLFPEFASCKIVYANQKFFSKDYKAPLHTLREDLVVDGQVRGYIEAGYSRESSSLDKGPFLTEEQPMLMTIARELSHIAERKLLEEEKDNLQQQLLHADRLVTVGQLTAGVAHELNEPLGSILGFAQLMKKHGAYDGIIAQDVEKIIKASLHAREIIRKLMLFSRQTPPKKTLFNINERIEDGMYLLESRLKKSHIVLKKELADNLPEISIDPSQFHQVLVNLVVNAIQAMPNGGTLTIKTESAINAITMIIQDTGVGMTEEQMDKIFIPFYTSKDVNEGTGLGLPVALGIVQSHGGSISVDSKIDQGTLFHVKFALDGGQDAEEKKK